MVLCKIYRKAVSLKELEQRLAMEELARSTTPSASHNDTGSPVDSISSSDHEAAVHHDQQLGVMTTEETLMAGASAVVGRPSGSMKKEAADDAAAAVVRPATLSLPQLDAGGRLEWMQDPFLTQLRSPWMESWSPYYASVLNF